MMIRKAFLFVASVGLALGAGCGDSSSAGLDAPPDSGNDAGIARCDDAEAVGEMPDVFAVNWTWADFTFEGDPIFQDDPAMSGTLFLERQPDGTRLGVLSLSVVHAGDSTRDLLPAPLALIEASVADGVLTIAPGQIRSGLVTLTWDSLSMQLADTDDDGIADAACGRAAGEWTEIGGDVIDTVTFSSATVTARNDIREGAAATAKPPLRDQVIPGDPIAIHVSEPVRIADAETAIEILADNTPVAGTLTARNATSTGHASSFVFQAADFLPFGAELSLSVGTLEDLAANDITSAAEPLTVAPDPGPVTANLGFESDLAGWIPASTDYVFTGADYRGVTPIEGASQVVLEHNASLAGYVDVAADASSLDLALTLLSRETRIDRFTITVQAPGRPPEVVFDASSDIAVEGTPCDCEGYDLKTGPLDVTIELEPYRGERVFLVFEVDSPWFIGIIPVAAILDDLSIQ